MAGPIFISHARGDTKWCEDLRASLLRQIRAEVYLDAENNLPGIEWKPHLWEAFKRSSAFLVVVSAHAARSAWVRDEVEKAIALVDADPTRIIIPLLCDAGVGAHEVREISADLARFQYADFRESRRRDEVLHRVVYVLKHPEVLTATRSGGPLVEIPTGPWWLRALRAVRETIEE